MSALFGVMAPRVIQFTVYGTPRPQGSMRAFANPKGKFPIVTSDNRKLKPWRQQLSGEAVSLGVPKFERDAALELRVDFYFARPPSVPKKRKRPTVKPDGDKCLRAIADALKGILIEDDAQIVDWHGRKFYGQPERVEISLVEVL